MTLCRRRAEDSPAQLSSGAYALVFRALGSSQFELCVDVQTVWIFRQCEVVYACTEVLGLEHVGVSVYVSVYAGCARVHAMYTVAFYRYLLHPRAPTLSLLQFFSRAVDS